jgi:L-asparagine transporter-like permease
MKGTTSLYDMLSDYSMFGAVAFETLAIATIFVFRGRVRSEEPNAYRSPLFPLLPAIYVVAMAAVLVNMFWTKWLQSSVGVGFVALGLVVYLFTDRRPRTMDFSDDRTTR